jgi:hypothetical protein
MGRPGMAVMPVQVLFIPSVFFLSLVHLRHAVQGRIFHIVSVGVEVLMEMGMAVSRCPMVMLVLVGMAMGVLVPLPAVMVMFLFQFPYPSLLICTSSDRYSALSASVV